MRAQARKSLSQADVWETVGIDPRGPEQLWERFESGDPTLGGLQIMALWVLQAYVARHQLRLA
jgi:hypothetical protein